jgi:hypothetical protein
MGVITRVTMRLVVTAPLTVTLSISSEPEPPPLPGTPTGMLLWSGTPVIGLTRLSMRWKGSDDSSDGWMFAHVQMEMQVSIDSQTSMMHDLFGHFRINLDA